MYMIEYCWMWLDTVECEYCWMLWPVKVELLNNLVRPSFTIIWPVFCIVFWQVREQVMARYRLATHRKTYEDVINEDVVPNIRFVACYIFINVSDLFNMNEYIHIIIII